MKLLGSGLKLGRENCIFSYIVITLIGTHTSTG